MSTRPELAIRIDEAVVAYREDTVLNGVSMAVARGEFVGIIGPNGAGKTTLLTLVNGLGRLVHGRVRVLGLDPYDGAGRRVRRQAGYVAQVERIDPRLPISVRDTVMTGLYGKLGWLRRPRRQQRRLVEDVLERVGMAHLARRPIGQLSGGEYQRAAIARALVQEPDVFLFDEPTASIDPQAQTDILDLVQDIHRQSSATTLYVTHDLATLPHSCERLVLMKAGRIWRDGPRGEMLDDAMLQGLYRGLEGAQRSAAPRAKA